MTLSIVIVCWNDWKVLEPCLRAITATVRKTHYEIVLSDNGSTDDTVSLARAAFPSVKIVENGTNLGFSAGNNRGIRVAQGRYVLILNPDTIVHSDSLDRWVEFAERHPTYGAFGCTVLNPDGSYQQSARPFPTVLRTLVRALYLHPLGYLCAALDDRYVGWSGQTERDIDWQSGCCLLFRRDVLTRLNGFDERFFYHYEEVDLCRRLWLSGYHIRYTPGATITHLGGQSVGRYPLRFAIETSRNRYRYFYKHFGAKGAIRCRYAMKVHNATRLLGYRLIALFRKDARISEQLITYSAIKAWTAELDPIAFAERGCEPVLRTGSEM